MDGLPVPRGRLCCLPSCCAGGRMVSDGPRLLTLDLETSPNIAHVWGLWKNNVSLNQLIQSTNVISFAAKWHGDKRVLFRSDHHDGHEVMIQKAHGLLGEADAVIHYNGKS